MDVDVLIDQFRRRVEKKMKESKAGRKQRRKKKTIIHTRKAWKTGIRREVENVMKK